ncbi:hypothetical protein Pmar_PMAR017679 [Perkinsus marinus ATCC 50983]|uniref:Uncharacterized protein n=1 Tax=Perkinsus marinus (strain ATCC 50983 / TXsc) TaxID=423536 RepID=C5L3P5_PERM5|nr:hypothetical protein Pmar_PMAR017679 [Perkinsus marinus ATCC 50983]EER08624.1 hypothetical protein Pmar_PMAR017679 [Perkinsus marinus ATCC 50983]|eukprot:XP_002776808.1 hypothetical protein Pmar_PMAR017679 [Perkinsus marinus ATCC 50983]
MGGSTRQMQDQRQGTSGAHRSNRVYPHALVIPRRPAHKPDDRCEGGMVYRTAPIKHQ